MSVFELKAVVEDITFLEPRSVTQARVNERVAAAEAQNQALQTQPAPAQAPVVAATAPQPAVASAIHSEELPFS